MPGSVKKLTYLRAIGITIVTTIPFYEIVRSIVELNSESFVPCNKEPCAFNRFGSAGGIAGTDGIFVHVQNGITRPVMAVGGANGHQGWFPTSSAHAMPILYNRSLPLARALGVDISDFQYLLSVPYGLPCGVGGFTYTWPNNHAYMVCAFGVCVDDTWHLSFMSLGQSEHINEAISQVRTHQGNDTEVSKVLKDDSALHAAVQELNTGLKKSVNVVASAAISFKRPPAELVYWAYAAILKRMTSIASGPELLPSARCGRPKEEFQAYCATSEARSKIVNPLAEALSTRIFKIGILGWASGKALHDVLLLCGETEPITQTVGIVSVVFQALACAAGFMVAMGAVQVFAAPVDQPMTSEEPCSCYYKLDDFSAMLMMSTPILLLITLRLKLKSIVLACLSGDFLYFQQFDVPYYWVRQHRGWETQSFMTYSLQGSDHSMGKRPRHVKAGACLYRLVRFVSGRAISGLDYFVVPAVMLSMSSVFPKAMAYLMRKFQTTTGLERLFFWLLNFAPATAFVVTASLMLWEMYVTKRTKYKIVVAGVCFFSVSMSLLLPPLEVLLGSQHFTAVETYTYMEVWKVGGFLVGLLCVQPFVQQLFVFGEVHKLLHIHLDAMALSQGAPIMDFDKLFDSEGQPRKDAKAQVSWISAEQRLLPFPAKMAEFADRCPSLVHGCELEGLFELCRSQTKGSSETRQEAEQWAEVLQDWLKTRFDDVERPPGMCNRLGDGYELVPIERDE